MNKTVNINLAGVFFHIDEDAFQRLHNYLEAVKKSISDSQGRDEIVRDIEARIAELFREKTQGKSEVIGLSEVEEVINVMGQPEDYRTDDEIFEDEDPKSQKHTKTETHKKLFRDPADCYLAGVSSGLAHYFGTDPIWIRLLWILLVIASGGTLVLGYFAFWIFVPEAKTTAEKLQMRGQPVNIGNIEKKVKEGFDSVADKMKNVDYERYGREAKSGAKQFFEALGNVILWCLKVIAKFIGILLLLFAGTTLIALFFGLFSVGVFGFTDAPWIDYVDMANIGAPLWLLSLMAFFLVGIPFVFLFILGLKILVPKLKSIGMTAKLVLLGIWLISLFVLGFFGIKQSTRYAFHEEVILSETLSITKNDTLYLEMRGSETYQQGLYRDIDDLEIKYDENGNKVLFSQDVRLMVRKTRDSLAYFQIEKSAYASGSREATKYAKEIFYAFDIQGNRLLLDGFFTTPAENGFHEQEILVNLYLPVGSVLFPSEETHYYHGYDDLLFNATEGHYLEILENGSRCLDCPKTGSNKKDGDLNIGEEPSIKSDTLPTKSDSLETKP